MGPHRGLPRAGAQPRRRLARSGSGSPARARDRRSSSSLIAARVVAHRRPFIPTLVDQVNDFVDAVPGLRRRPHEGPRAARLPRDEVPPRRARSASGRRTASASEAARPVRARRSPSRRASSRTSSRRSRSSFMTFFMLLEGPMWVERFFGAAPGGVSAALAGGRPRHLPDGRRLRHRQPLISLIAGMLDRRSCCSIIGVPFAVALGLIVAILDLIPLAGATIAAIVVGTVAFLHSITAGIVVVAFFILYQQVENHVLQPLVYGRTVRALAARRPDLRADRRRARGRARGARRDSRRRDAPGAVPATGYAHRRRASPRRRDGRRLYPREAVVPKV